MKDLGKAVITFSLTVQMLSFVSAREFFVAPYGDDSSPGTSVEQPFRTIQRAAEALSAGDTCFIRAGVYRETVKIAQSGDKEAPLNFTSYRGERVILEGSDRITSPWVRAGGNVWKTRVRSTEPIEAVFQDGQMMVEARWPDCTWEENWNPSRKWALTGKDSTLGRIRSPSLAQSGLDLSGGLLYIKLSKGNNCFTRPVTDHRSGADAFSYDKTGIEGRAWNEDSMPERIKKFGFEGNRFFVVARGALDRPGEWWHDFATGELFFIPPGGDIPGNSVVSFKRRVTGFEGVGVSDLIIDGVEFRACNVRFEKGRRITLRNCRFLYPSTPKLFPDGKTALEMQENLRIEGEQNTVENCEVAWAVDGALEIEGTGNRVENCVVHDSNLHGRHPGPGISVRGSSGSTSEPNIVRRCTVYNVGGVGIYALGSVRATLEHNHVFNGGLYCVDVSSIYVPTGGRMPGTVVHHNWLHDTTGIGFRVDIEGRDIIFHHNLVWNAAVGCKMQGFQLEGYNNTVLVNDPKSGFIVVFEPEATDVERAGWRVQNNVAYAFLDRLSLRSDYRNAERPFLLPLEPEEGVVDHNGIVNSGEEDRLFLDPAHFDFRPMPGGPLDGTGVVVRGIAEGKSGRGPSIGALEADELPWVAGADWMNDGLQVPKTVLDAVELARRLRPVTFVMMSRDEP